MNPVDGGALFSFLAWSKQSVVADPADAGDLELVERLLQSADAVVWSRGSRLAGLDSLAPQQILDRHPHLIVTTITPFGLDGPWRDRAATEFTLQAWSGGALGIGRGEQSRAPAHVGGQIGDWLTGAYAAASRWRRGPARSTPAGVNWSTCRCSRPRSSASPTTR